MIGGCSCSLDEDCHCSIEEHQSPLMEVHFLRIIMDEGHEFSSSGHRSTVYWALQKLCVDRKWIVSGTPASGLLGVEVGTAAFETSHSVADDHGTYSFGVIFSVCKQFWATCQLFMHFLWLFALVLYQTLGR